MSSLLWFDAVLSVFLVAVACGALLARDLFQAIVLFIVFGLLLAIAWCRLSAFDVALAEAAIGAGLTGALLLNTLSTIRRHGGEVAERCEEQVTTPRTVLVAFMVSTLLIACGLGVAVMPLVALTDAPRISLEAAMPFIGVTHPVTAVLLNFRAYDTLLEVAVLLVSVWAILPIATTGTCVPRGRFEEPSGPVLTTFVRLLVPLVVLVGTYVLWKGTSSAGGAFQAAALLSAGGVLCFVTGVQPPSWLQWRWRVVLVGGIAIFLTAGAVGCLFGGRFIEYPPQWSGAWIIFIETGLTVSLALNLMWLFTGTSANQELHL